MTIPVLVYGWYGKKNAGDELMKLALDQLLRAQGLLPKFVDTITERDVVESAGVIFGGGSILIDHPVISPTAAELLIAGTRPSYYVGVGGETDISPFHQTLINRSPVVAFRELDIPDLAYWHAHDVKDACKAMAKKPEGVLVVVNVEVIPSHNDLHWVHSSWEHFKNEFAQVLDLIVERGHRLSFLAMCDADKKRDVWAAHELMGRMKNRDRYHVYQPNAGDPLWVCGLMQAHQVVITQRYHGIVLAEMSGVPYVSISHHDKLRLTHPHRGQDMSYHGTQKDVLWSQVESAFLMQIDPYQPSRSVYDDVISRIAAAIKEHR